MKLYIPDYVLPDQLPFIKQAFEEKKYGKIKDITLVHQLECEYQVDQDIYSGAILDIDYFNDNEEAREFCLKLDNYSKDSKSSVVRLCSPRGIWDVEWLNENTSKEVNKKVDLECKEESKVDNMEVEQSKIENDVESMNDDESVNDDKSVNDDESEENSYLKLNEKIDNLVARLDNESEITWKNLNYAVDGVYYLLYKEQLLKKKQDRQLLAVKRYRQNLISKRRWVGRLRPRKK